MCILTAKGRIVQGAWIALQSIELEASMGRTDVSDGDAKALKQAGSVAESIWIKAGVDQLVKDAVKAAAERAGEDS